MIYVHRCMIVPAAIAPICRALAEALAGPAGENMWTTPLSPTGEEPATHYVSSGMVGEDMIAYLTDAALLAGASGMSLAEAEALIAAADITDEQPSVAFARVGLGLSENPDPE